MNLAKFKIKLDTKASYGTTISVEGEQVVVYDYQIRARDHAGNLKPVLVLEIPLDVVEITLPTSKLPPLPITEELRSCKTCGAGYKYPVEGHGEFCSHECWEDSLEADRTKT